MRVALHAGAELDLTEAGDWYEKQSGLALKFAADVDRALDVIVEAPYTWPRWPGVSRGLNVRRFLLSAFPFAIGYLLQPARDRVVVLAVAHTSRRRDYWIERLKDPNL